MSSVLQLPASKREEMAERLLDRLTPVMSGLGILFLLVVLGERSARPGTALAVAFTVTGWLLWGVFVADFLVRAAIAPSTAGFLRRNWWQIIFLALPFLRALRLVRSLRVLRGGRVLSSAIRSTRSTHRVLGDRVAWLGMVTAIVVLASAEVLSSLSFYDTYGDALHASALAATTGEPLALDEAFPRLLEVVLGVYSVGVFATLAGTAGAYFLESRAATGPAPAAAQASPGRAAGDRTG